MPFSNLISNTPLVINVDASKTIICEFISEITNKFSKSFSISLYGV